MNSVILSHTFRINGKNRYSIDILSVEQKDEIKFMSLYFNVVPAHRVQSSAGSNVLFCFFLFFSKLISSKVDVAYFALFV